MNNNLLTTRWRLLRPEDLLLEREVRAVDRSHVAAERAREFDARDHAGLRGFGGASLERGASQHNAGDGARRRPPEARGLGRERVLIRSARLGDPPRLRANQPVSRVS